MVKAAPSDQRHQQSVCDAMKRVAEGVTDPELPVLTLGDLAMVCDVQPGHDEGKYIVSIVPSFTACPATDTILHDVQAALTAAGFEDFEVRRVLSPAWSSDWITPEGHKKLRAAGIAPPDRLQSGRAQGGPVQCPLCRSRDTVLVSAFGSTLCKSSHKCRACREPFEAFKCH